MEPTRARAREGRVAEAAIAAFEASLQRCSAEPDFLQRFYDRFLASSPEVARRFAATDFDRQRRALRASFYLLMLAAEDSEKGPERYLADIAEQHSRKGLDVGAELYDLWLDSLLETVRECDPAYGPAVKRAWEDVMDVGIAYMLERYPR